MFKKASEALAFIKTLFQLIKKPLPWNNCKTQLSTASKQKNTETKMKYSAKRMLTYAENWTYQEKSNGSPRRILR